jgi:hypothetical protein
MLIRFDSFTTASRSSAGTSTGKFHRSMQIATSHSSIVTPPCEGVKWKETKQKANLFSNIKNPNSDKAVIHSFILLKYCSSQVVK